MNKVQLQTLSFFFAAILPPKSFDGNLDGEDNYTTKDSYYARLGVAKSSRAEDIRKAYKKKSLQYHPDKVAQFQSADSPKTEEEILADFVEVKEAYETLSDPRRRNAYDVLGQEGAKLINQSEGGGLLDTFEHHTLMHNLNRASLYSKIKLTLLILLLSLIIVAGPTLIFLRIDGKYGMQDMRWMLVFIPIWVLHALFFSFMVSSRRWFGAMKIICVMSGEVFLALKWDEIISWDYTFIFTPFYMHHFIVLTKNILEIRKVKKDLDRTVTVSYLEEKILPTFKDQWREGNDHSNPEISPWCSYANLTDRERDIINKEYIIIDNPFDYGDTFSNESMDPQTKLLYTVTRSPEYELAIKKKSQATRTIALILSIRVAFFILVFFKLDRAKKWNWFLIFSPILLEVGLLVCSSCWTCCCYGVIREEVVDKDSDMSASEIYDRGSDIEYLFEKDNDPIETEGEEIDTVWNAANMENVDALVINNSAQSQEHDCDRDTPLRVSSIDNEDKTSTESNLDSHSIEKQVKSFISSGVYVIFAVFLALLVVKLNGVEDGIDISNGISAFWVTLPIFMILGMTFLCVCCCICCAGEVESLENIVACKTTCTGSEHIGNDVESDSERTLQGNEVDMIRVEDSDGLD